MNDIVASSPETVWRKLWQKLESAAGDPSVAFGLPALATAGAEGAQVRTVVLRAASGIEASLTCHSDVRAQKVSQLRQQPRAEWMFYDVKERVQIRAEGSVMVHHQDEMARQVWDDLPPASRLNYCSAKAPGAPLDAAESVFQKDFDSRNLTLQETDFAFEHFAAIVTKLGRLDWLRLDRAGNERIIWERDSRQVWTAAHVVP